MTLHYSDDAVQLHHGDCLDVLRADVLGYDYRLGYAAPAWPDSSVDAVVTDPPYGLEFMGKDWDAPWKVGERGDDAAFVATGYTDGAERLARPTFTGNPNTSCSNCGGSRRGRVTEKGPKRCRCERPSFPNIAAIQGRAFQEWCEEWANECLRVLKPGGHMFAFGGSRTWHRLASAVEDAGFEIRDSIAWLYGQGFAKSLNLDNLKTSPFCRCEKEESSHDGDVLGVRRGVPATGQPCAAGEVPDMLTAVQREGTRSGVGHARGEGSEDARALHPSVWIGQPGLERRGNAEAAEGQLQGRAVRPLPGGVPSDGPSGRLHHGAPSGHGSVDRALPPADGGRQPQGSRPVEQRPGEPGVVSVERGSQTGRGWPVCERCAQPVIPAGLGTALKPAFEPIVVGRKPLAGTVAANVLEHGTGALNIDGCRIEAQGRPLRISHGEDTTGKTTYGSNGPGGGSHAAGSTDTGRWPTNVVLDESQAAELDQQTGTLTSGYMKPETDRTTRQGDAYGQFSARTATATYGDSGGASRFFPVFRYEAKAPTAERPRDGEVAHPTVKPLDLMRWLVRLVTPPGGTVLEPFAGSGTTAEACVIEGFRCIAVEREADYLPLIVARLSKPIQIGFDFGDGAA